MFKNSLILRGLSQRIASKIAGSDRRSKEALRNIVISLVVKVASIISSLLVLPLTIHYVNPTQYGIWLTLSTIIGWVTFFDLGLGNGFRNRFAEAKAKGDEDLACQYLSTTYFAVTVIVLLVYGLILFGNAFLDWSKILNVEESYREELHKIFAIVCGFVCLNMIANIFGTLLTADQKPGYASIIQGVGQYVSLIVIWILTKVSTGSLINLALYYSGVPCMVMLITSLYAYFFSSYRKYSPKIKNINVTLIKNIIGLGSQFFIIYLCLIAIFQIVNVVLSREIGPLGVTEYNIANRYFNTLYMVINIILTPYWSAFTDAYTQKDFQWMRKNLHYLEIIWFCSFIVGGVMLFLSPLFYDLWIGRSVSVSFVLSACVLLLTLTRTLGNIYMYLINGIGTIRIQLVTYVVFALIAWPALVFSCRMFGLCGIVIIPTIVYIIQSILGRLQINRILSSKANGIWSK